MHDVLSICHAERNSEEKNMLTSTYHKTVRLRFHLNRTIYSIVDTAMSDNGTFAETALMIAIKFLLVIGYIVYIGIAVFGIFILCSVPYHAILYSYADIKKARKEAKELLRLPNEV